MSATTQSPFRWPLAGAMAALALLLYGIGTMNHGFVLDDNLVITSNEHVRDGWSGIPDLFKYNYAHGHEGFNDGLYRPLSLVTFAIEQAVIGLNPSISHGVQSLLYAMCIIALMLWLHALFPKHNNWYWWVALLFALHPVHTEVVANLKSRDELMGFLFAALSAWMFVKFLHESKRHQLFIAAFLYLIALFSKESIITMLAVFPLMYWYVKPIPDISWKTAAIPLAVMTIPALIFLSIRQVVLAQLGTPDGGVSSLLQNPLIKNDGLMERLATGSVIQLLYLKQLIWPMVLSHDYSYNTIPVMSFGDMAAMLGMLICAALLFISIRGVAKRKWWAFGGLFYFVTISVVANVFLLIGAVAAERFLFLPSLGWCIAVVVLADRFLTNKKVLIGALSVYALIFLSFTALRIPDWKSNETLFLADVDKVPESARAHYNAGSVLLEPDPKTGQFSSRRLSAAIEHFQKALEIWPDYQDAWNNLGISYMNSTQYEKAYETYQKSLERFPDYIRQRYNMGMTCFQLKRYSEAEQHFETYLESYPKVREILFHLAESEGYQQKFDEAIDHLEALKSIEPNKHRSHLKLGMAYGIVGDTLQAFENLRRAHELAPNLVETNFNLAIYHVTAGGVDKALPLLNRCLAIDPTYQPALDIMGRIDGQ